MGSGNSDDANLSAGMRLAIPTDFKTHMHGQKCGVICYTDIYWLSQGWVTVQRSTTLTLHFAFILDWANLSRAVHNHTHWQIPSATVMGNW